MKQKMVFFSNRISKELNGITRLLLGQSSFSSAIILSCIGSQILKEYSVGAFLHLMGYTAAVFLLCETGQTILDETFNVRHAVYASDWHLADSSLAKDIQFVLLRSQKPILMDSYLFGSFSYSLLIVIVKTAYSYLTLMNKSSI
ncbi:hypothetical protein HUJ04_008396 [Dendroctonus ponderosae]|nr:hypothetical protein HUJ04_008396 [Dendroctonus ponderosae]